MTTSGIAQQVSAFQAYTTKDGLPSNYVMDIDEDENGFLWIGTDKGLAKFDGFTWQVFTTDDGLPGNYIHNVICTGKGSLWLGVSSKGLYHYNISSGKVTLVATGVSPYETQLNSNGDLFFYTFEKGSDIKIGNYVKIDSPGEIHKIFTYNNSSGDYSVVADFKKQCLELIKNINSGKHGSSFLQNHLNWKTDTLKFTVDYTDLLRKLNDSVYTNPNSLYLLRSKNGSKPLRIIGPHNEYLHILSTATGHILWDEKTGLYEVNKTGEIEKHYTEKDGLTNSMVTDVKQTKNNKLLISTLGGGLLIKLPERNVRISTDGAVKSFAQKDNTIYALLEGKLLLFNLDNITTVQEFKVNEKNVQAVNVWGNDIYISTLSGFSVYNITGNQLQKKRVQYIGAGVSSVIEYHDKYYAGSYGSHIWVQSKDDKIMGEGSVASMEVSEKLLPLSNCYAAINYEDGLQLIYDDKNRINLSVKDGLPANAVYDVHEYKDTLWISTAKGIAAYAKGKVVKTFTVVNGIKGNRCLYSFHDNNGGYWVVTDKYLNELKNNEFVALSSAPIIEGKDDVVQSFAYNFETNTLVTGSLKRIFITQLNSIERTLNNTGPSLQTVSYDKKVIAEMESFVLPSTFSDISFSFKPLDANPFIKPEIYYKLKGSSDNYILITDSPTIHFSKLRSGTYKLYAKSVNQDGVESEEKLMSVFSVDAPYWQKRWFILLSILASGLAAHILATAYQKRKQKQKERELKLEQQLLNERERISRELHDNLGSSLVTIIAQSDNIETKLRLNQPADALKKVQELNDQSRETMNILRETIWAVQEESHSFQSFVSRIQDFLQRCFSATNIECSCDMTGNLSKNLSPEQTLNVFRCIQECTQNIIKHSQASKANYIFAALDEKLSIHINDNGKGFDVEKKYSSNGIRNIHSRIKELQGNSEITSAINKGTTINIEITV